MVKEEQPETLWQRLLHGGVAEKKFVESTHEVYEVIDIRMKDNGHFSLFLKYQSGTTWHDLSFHFNDLTLEATIEDLYSKKTEKAEREIERLKRLGYIESNK